MYNLAR